MLTKTGSSLLQQHGRKAPTSSGRSTQKPKKLEQKSGIPYGWKPYSIVTARDEMLFEADPIRFINDPRFAGRRRTS